MKNFKQTWLFWLVMFITPFALIVVSGLISHQIQFNVSIEFFCSIIVAISTSLIASGIIYLFIDKKLQKLLQEGEITIVLQSPNGKKRTCPPMSRKSFKRAEVLGFLGMIYSGPGKYEIKFIAMDEFFKRISKIEQGQGDQLLIIECSNEEIEPFMLNYKNDQSSNDVITIVPQSNSDI